MTRAAIIVVVGFFLALLTFGAAATQSADASCHHAVVHGQQISDTRCIGDSAGGAHVCPMPGMCAAMTCVAGLDHAAALPGDCSASRLLLRPPVMARLVGLELPPPLAPPRTGA